jgi:hypothetical protein
VFENRVLRIGAIVTGGRRQGQNREFFLKFYQNNSITEDMMDGTRTG